VPYYLNNGGFWGLKNGVSGLVGSAGGGRRGVGTGKSLKGDTERFLE
jgi:hypothetical protein